MPNAIYSYVYYEPVSAGYTRQDRDPAVSSKYLPVPDITVPSTNDLASGSTFHPDLPPQTFTDIAGDIYHFGFMNVSGCVGAGETSTDYNNLPGSAGFAPLIVGDDETKPINILVMYIQHGNGVGGPGGPGIYLDAFNETTGEFLNNFFVTGVAPDAGYTSNVNVYGTLPVVAAQERLTAAGTPIDTPTVVNSTATFDKWVILEGDGIPVTNPTLAGNDLVVDGNTAGDIAAFAFYKDQASVYITGSYQSPDIILFSPFSATTMGTAIPIGSGDTTVIAGTDYGFAAYVHNGSEYEVSTKVTFWTIPGGLATSGMLLDTQTVPIPPSSSKMVYSSAAFVNAGGHTCAAVSIDTADSPCQFSPTSSADAVNIPDPNADVSHSCSAWRNTDTAYVFPGEHWRFKIPIDIWGPVELNNVRVEVQAHYVPDNFTRTEHAMEETRVNRRIYGKAPAYLIPALNKKLPLADFKPVISLQSKGEIAAHEKGGFMLKFANQKESEFNVSATIPANAKPGDTYLVKLTAHYPKVERRRARSVEFLEILIVKGRK